ncbi:MAG: oligosaccharide flippase family protein [Chloroflexi bacterium]|nr:oligosaccharide flippase family protein [Chloroflexota bacterium]
MRSVLRSTLMLSGSSFASILVGLVSAKVWAILLGPRGVGLMGLLQSLLGLAALVMSLGIGAGLVSMGASALAQGDDARFAALRRAGWRLNWLASGLALLLMTVFRVPISRWMLGGPQFAGAVLLVSLALLFQLASSIQTSLLNAHHRVAALARVGVLSSVLGTAASLAVVGIWRGRGIALAVIVNAVLGWIVSAYFLRREIAPPATPPARGQVAEEGRALLRFGAPYAASQMVGAGVQFALPALVLHTLSVESVGFYRSAMSVSGVYLGFLLLAMGQDYYPRVSAVSEQPDELGQLVNQQHRLVMLIAAPLILVLLAVTPYLIPLIYSAEFAPAAQVLEWQLIGDLFKFASWTMGFVILARRYSLTLFLVELLAGVNILVFSRLGIHWFGLAGLGLAYLLTYLVHYVVVWLIVRKDIGLVWTAQNKLMLLAATLAAFTVRVLPAIGLERFRTPVALSLGLLAGAWSLHVIWREAGLQSFVRAWLGRTRST